MRRYALYRVHVLVSIAISLFLLFFLYHKYQTHTARPENETRRQTHGVAPPPGGQAHGSDVSHLDLQSPNRRRLVRALPLRAPQVSLALEETLLSRAQGLGVRLQLVHAPPQLLPHLGGSGGGGGQTECISPESKHTSPDEMLTACFRRAAIGLETKIVCGFSCSE